MPNYNLNSFDLDDFGYWVLTAPGFTITRADYQCNKIPSLEAKITYLYSIAKVYATHSHTIISGNEICFLDFWTSWISLTSWTSWTSWTCTVPACVLFPHVYCSRMSLLYTLNFTTISYPNISYIMKRRNSLKNRAEYDTRQETFSRSSRGSRRKRDSNSDGRHNTESSTNKGTTRQRRA